jgi:hypothetical protein
MHWKTSMAVITSRFRHTITDCFDVAASRIRPINKSLNQAISIRPAAVLRAHVIADGIDRCLYNRYRKHLWI